MTEPQNKTSMNNRPKPKPPENVFRQETERPITPEQITRWFFAFTYHLQTVIEAEMKDANIGRAQILMPMLATSSDQARAWLGQLNQQTN